LNGSRSQGGATIDAPTPDWLQKAAAPDGVRSIGGICGGMRLLVLYTVTPLCVRGWINIGGTFLGVSQNWSSEVMW